MLKSTDLGAKASLEEILEEGRGIETSGTFDINPELTEQEPHEDKQTPPIEERFNSGCLLINQNSSGKEAVEEEKE